MKVNARLVSAINWAGGVWNTFFVPAEKLTRALLLEELMTLIRVSVVVETVPMPTSHSEVPAIVYGIRSFGEKTDEKVT